MENFYSWWDQACKARTCPRTKCVLATSGRIPGASLIDIEWRPWMKMACDQIPIRSRDKPRGSGEQSACVPSTKASLCKGSAVPGMFEDEREGRHSCSPIHLPKWNLRRSRSATSFLHNCTRDVKLCSWNLRQARACLWEIIIFPQRKKIFFHHSTAMTWMMRVNSQCPPPAPGRSWETTDEKGVYYWEQSEERTCLFLQHISLLSAPRSWLRTSRKCLLHVNPDVHWQPVDFCVAHRTQTATEM